MVKDNSHILQNLKIYCRFVLFTKIKYAHTVYTKVQFLSLQHVSAITS